MLAPQLYKWDKAIAECYLALIDESDRQRQNVYRAKALKAYEAAIGCGGYDQNEEINLLYNTTCCAYSLRDSIKAKVFAVKTIEKLRSAEITSVRARSWHDVNVILGLIELDGGDVRLASEYLLAAIRVPEEVRFISRPSIMLAERLLDVGEFRSVLLYLDRLQKHYTQADAFVDRIRIKCNSMIPDQQ